MVVKKIRGTLETFGSSGDDEFIEVTAVMGVSLAHGAVLLDTINRIFKTEYKLDEFDGR